MAATALGSLWGRPIRSAAVAAISTPWSSTATTASSGCSLVERHDRVDRGAEIRHGYDERAGAHLVRHRLAFLGSDDHLHTEASGGAHEVGGPVRGCGQQEKNARHGPIMTRMTSEAASPILTITEDAMAKVVEVRATETDPESLVLWVEVSGQQAGAYTYLMEFRTESELDDDVAIQHHDDVSVAIPADSIDLLRGATLELSGGGMVMQNPNRPQPVVPYSPAVDPDRPHADLSGEVPQRVIQVLDQEINPAIASHGGHAELVAVEGSIAYLRLSGGCQGCGMAAVTLSQGIEVAILDSIPEITEVIDVTDHATGANPYYEAAKK